MEKNIGATDAALRIYAGVTLLAVAVVAVAALEGTVAIVVAAVAGALAAISLVEARTRVCLLYRAFGVSTA